MYFPGDPLFEHDPIFQSVRDREAQQRMISTFDLRLGRSGLWASASISCSTVVAPPRSRGPTHESGPDPLPDNRPLLPRRPPRQGSLRASLPGPPSAIKISGAVYDGAEEIVTDAMVEIWQADPAGRYDDAEVYREDLLPERGFTGFGRSGTVGGQFSFVTLKPGPVLGPDGNPRPRTSWSPSSPEAS